MCVCVCVCVWSIHADYVEFHLSPFLYLSIYLSTYLSQHVPIIHRSCQVL